MRLWPIPFRFRVLQLGEGLELTYLPKLGDREIGELSGRLASLGYRKTKSAMGRPDILRFADATSSIRIMPRGLLMGSVGTFEKLGGALDLKASRQAEEALYVSWEDNDYQRLTAAKGALVYHARPRHFPSRRRFASEISKVASPLSADEVYMMAATAEASGADAVEVLTSSAGDAEDLSPPVPLAGRGFLHHVRLPMTRLADDLDRMIEECLAGSPPICTLPDSTVLLSGASLASVRSTGDEGKADALGEWVLDRKYLRPAWPIL